MNKDNEKKQVKHNHFFKCFSTRDIFAYKGFSFFLYGAFGGFYPYLPLYFKQYGLSSLQAGSIVGLRPIIQVIGAPFWTTVGERFKAEKIVLMFGVLSWLIKALVVYSITPSQQLCVLQYVNSTSNVTSVYKSDLWAKRTSKEDIKWTLSVVKKPGVVLKNQVVQGNQTKASQNSLKVTQNKHENKLIEADEALQAKTFFIHEIVNTANHFAPNLNATISYMTEISKVEIKYLYLIFLLIMIIGEFMESPSYALSDASLLDRLGDDRSYYGQIRLWGAIGWAITAAAVGALIYIASSTLCGVIKPDYNVIFYVYFGFVSCALFCTYWFSFKPKEHQKPSTKQAVKVLLSFNHVVFMVAVIFTGGCYGFLFHFVNWYIDDRGGSSLVMGAAAAARELGEMTFFLLGGACVRFLGNLNTMAICLSSYSACCYLYSIISSPWYAIPLELLDGSIYGLVWSNSVSYMSSVGAPIGAVVTMQGILQGLFYGLGNGGGTVVGGHLYNAIGPQTTFQYFAISCLVVLLFLLVAFPVADSCLANPIETDRTEYEPISREGEETPADEPAIPMPKAAASAMSQKPNNDDTESID